MVSSKPKIDECENIHFTDLVVCIQYVFAAWLLESTTEWPSPWPSNIYEYD